jgi:hypothetical protein
LIGGFLILFVAIIANCFSAVRDLLYSCSRLSILFSIADRLLGGRVLLLPGPFLALLVLLLFELLELIERVSRRTRA